MLSLVKEDYCISDLQEGLLCLKRVEYNQDKPRAGDALVEGFSGFVAGQMESSAARASAMEHPTRRAPRGHGGFPATPAHCTGYERARDGVYNRIPCSSLRKKMPASLHCSPAFSPFQSHLTPHLFSALPLHILQ